MTYHISPFHNAGQPTIYRLAGPSGNLVHTTEGSVFVTFDRNEAEAAAAYLNQAGTPRTGSHKFKSLFGVLG